MAPAPAAAPPPPPRRTTAWISSRHGRQRGHAETPSAPRPPPPAPISPPPHRRAKAAEARAARAAAANSRESWTRAAAEVQRALVVGDYPGAVAACRCGASRRRARPRPAEAPNSGSSRARAHRGQHFQAAHARCLRFVVAEDLGAIVKSRVLGARRETLAILCTCAPAEEWERSPACSPGDSRTLGTRTRDAGHICAETSTRGAALDGRPPLGEGFRTALHSVLEKSSSRPARRGRRARPA